MTITTHNLLPVKEVCPGHYEVADFRGHYVSVLAPSAEQAVQNFVNSRACSYDTPFEISRAWRAAGCPTRQEWIDIIVFETGELTSSIWKDAQKLPNEWYVSISAVESFGILK